MIVNKGQSAIIEITKETETELEGTLVGPTPLKVEILKSKYKYKAITA